MPSKCAWKYWFVQKGSPVQKTKDWMCKNLKRLRFGKTCKNERTRRNLASKTLKKNFCYLIIDEYFRLFMKFDEPQSWQVKTHPFGSVSLKTCMKHVLLQRDRESEKFFKSKFEQCLRSWKGFLQKWIESPNPTFLHHFDTTITWISANMA